MSVNKEQRAKSVHGNSFEKHTYAILRNKQKELDITKLKAKKRFYYSEKTLEEMIAETINSSAKKYTKTELEKYITRAIKNSINSKSGDVLRSKSKFYKEADISFLTNKKFYLNGKLTQIRFIIDNTTSARTDRIKGKAQDSIVYSKFGFAYIPIINMPDDEFFSNYKDPNKEIKLCQSAVYDANFCNLYKDQNISLIVREKDLFNLLSYLMKNEGKDINTLIEKWKKTYYKEMVLKRKSDVNKYIKNVTAKTIKLVEQSKMKG